jgi:hypothetical protein
VSKPDKKWAIRLLCQLVSSDPLPSIRALSAEALVEIGQDDPEAIEALNYAALNDPEESVRTQLIQAIRNFHRPQSLIAMSEQPKVQMNFNAPVTGVAGNVEGDFMVNASEQDLETILTDITQILENLKQKHPTPPTEQTAIAIIDAEFQEIKQTQPWRWQNLLSLQRLWKGSKTAALKIGEHFAEENPWGKGIIGFLEGVAEEVN